jgi:hypothetical protein
MVKDYLARLNAFATRLEAYSDLMDEAWANGLDNLSDGDQDIYHSIVAEMDRLRDMIESGK